MASRLCVLAPPSLLAPGRAALTASDDIELRVPADVEARQRLAEQRLLLERRRAQGWGAVEAEAALAADASLRVAVLLEAGAADAGLLDSAAASALLEPASGHARTPLWLAHAPATGGRALTLGWIDGLAGEEISRTADRLISAVAWLQARLQPPQPVRAIVIRLQGGPHPRQALLPRLLPTLAARTQFTTLDIYAGWIFANGEIDVRALVETIGGVARGALPVVYAPALERAMVMRAWRAAGGAWSGAWNAGARVLAVNFEADAPASEWTATLPWLRRLSARS